MKVLHMLVEMVRVVHLAAGQLRGSCGAGGAARPRLGPADEVGEHERGAQRERGAPRQGGEAAVAAGGCGELHKETLMALRLAGACGYLPPTEAAAAQQEVASVIRVLWVLAYRR